MKTCSLIADSTSDALARIREQLGPQAVVLKMWNLPAAGLSRLWQKPRVGVLAGVVEGAANEQDLRVDLLERISELNRQLPPLSEQDRDTIQSLLAAASEPFKTHATQPQTHLLVGPPGVGKTTCLSKWLAQSVLLGGHTAHIWRLDGRTANTAESLSVYAEILGVPVARSWSADPAATPTDISFIDLPGIDCFDAGALDELRQRIADFGGPSVHLVLNAAYELPLLLKQAERFSCLSIADVIFTHLDEQREMGKLRNFASAVRIPISFLSAGQNVPGTFRRASAGLLASSTFSEINLRAGPDSASSGKASAERGGGL